MTTVKKILLKNWKKYMKHIHSTIENIKHYP